MFFSDPLSLAATARTRIAAIAPTQAIYGVQTLEEDLSDSIAPRRLNFFLLIGFAGVSLLMAAIGIYGVVAYSVAQRTREIGIRRALGASGWGIAASVFQYGLIPALAGITVGLLGAMALAKWMASLIYGVEPLDFLTFATVPIILAATVAIACAIPAARAARIDPLLSLREE